EGGGQVGHEELARRQLDVEVRPFFDRECRERPVEHRLGGGNQLDDDAFAACEIGADRGDERWELHPDQKLAEEPLLGGFEDRKCGCLGTAVVGVVREAVGNASRVERGAQVRVDDRLSRGRGNAQERGVVTDFP
ncbi:MAG: hypothetical protein K2Y51_20270, partial [Gammaproteobacteria bacterium]|nr:hypothetical protein [Gammaproteobacteria bacterium]